MRRSWKGSVFQDQKARPVARELLLIMVHINTVYTWFMLFCRKWSFVALWWWGSQKHFIESGGWGWGWSPHKNKRALQWIGNKETNICSGMTCYLPVSGEVPQSDSNSSEQRKLRDLFGNKTNICHSYCELFQDVMYSLFQILNFYR